MNPRTLQIIFLFLLLAAPLPSRAQSGRQRPAPQASPSPAAQRPRRATPAPEADAPPGQPATPSAPSRTGEANQSSPAPASDKSSTANAPVEVDDDEVYKVNSNLVPVSANASDVTGRAITDLKLEDFELRVDGQPKPISDLSHSETPVRIALLFDNSSSIRPTRELEKQAAVHFFRSVLRPVDQAAIFSIETVPQLSQPLTNDAARLARTIERFGDVQESSTPLFDTIVMAADYLRPQPGRKVLIIVSDGVETTSNLQDYGEMVRRVLASDCQVFVVQPGLSENANLRDLIAERRMQDLSSYTGGFVFVPKVPSDLEVAFTQIAADLAQQYVLSYYPTDDGRDGRFRVITLRVTTRPNVRVRARRGYYPRRRDNLSSRQQNFDTDAVSRPPDSIDDPAFAAIQPAAARRDVSTNGAGAIVNTKPDAAPSSRAPSVAVAPPRASKNLDPESSGSSQSDDAATNTRPVVRLAAPDTPASGVANNSPPAKDATGDRPPDARAQPATQPDNDKPNAATATPAPNSASAASSVPSDPADVKAKESPSSPARQSAAQKSAPPASQDSTTRDSAPRQSPSPAAQSQPARTSPQPAEPPQKLTVAGGVLNGRAKSLPVPVYPDMARRMRVAGTVVVEVMVDESGRVLETRAASGPALLRQAAVDAARQARFPPTLVGGQPARLAGVINYTFTF
ncbi:MAG TPA: VWA domain-containing protein [Pyrinomonadaceae bacterium]|jgi:Ca-activated chloride channel family protein|nr:VWA domain-containing protein [Pyrinomonadaceae bacterium]